MFGPHLMVDAYGCDKAKLEDLGLVASILDELPPAIDMTKIMPPYVFKYHAPVPQDWGLSGFVLIAESHISIHTYPEKNYLSIDIFSCKSFDYQQAVAYATELFGIARHEINLLDRGLEFPKEVKTVENFLRQEREQLRG